MLALSTRCAPEKLPLARVVESFRDLEVRAVALHRPATPDEARELAAIRRGVSFVAVFGDEKGADVGAPILVVEGGPAGDDRERSLEDLCRRLHMLRDVRIGLRTAPDAAHHPAPSEIALVREALGGAVGYWHDSGRGGEEWLDAAARDLLGASFHPLEGDVDLAGLHDALPARAPAVVDCPPATAIEEVEEALRRARGIFRG